MGMIVLARGSLQGMGREVDCELVAVRRTVANRRIFGRRFEEIYSDFSVIEAPEDLPDGEYTVCVGRQIFATSKRRGLWLNCNEVAMQR